MDKVLIEHIVDRVVSGHYTKARAVKAIIDQIDTDPRYSDYLESKINSLWNEHHLLKMNFEAEAEELQERVANLEASHRETINNEKCALSLRERVTKIEEQLEQEKKITNHIGKRLDKKRRKV